MASLAGGDIRMLTAVAESTGESLVLGHGLFQLRAGLLMAWHTESPRCGHGIVDLQGMMGRVTAKAVTGDLALGMGFMAIGAVRDLTVHFVAEGTGLLGMGAGVFFEILARALMAGETRPCYIIGKVQRQGLMGI